jgi:transcriptional regulator with XRE-family HTH domain
MITPLGIFLRKFRIDVDESQKNMAEKLGMTAGYLSRIEIGTRTIPDNFCSHFADIYEMNETQKIQLMQAAHASKNHSGNIRLIDVFNLMIDMGQQILERHPKPNGGRFYQKGYMDALSELQKKLKNGEYTNE